jgi:inorganic pyrophosphatase
MNLWHIKTKKLTAVIEIPKGSRNKYELDKQTGAIHLSRVLFSPFHYPLNYGFIPRTLAQDQDPLDVMILGDELIPKSIVEIRPIALLKLKDQDIIDDKILAVLEKDPRYQEFKDLKNVPKHLLKEIEHFFTHYKDLEGKRVKVLKWLNKKQAEKEIKSAQENYSKHFS